MGGKKQASKPEFVGSLRNQRNIKEQWRLESELRTCNGQAGIWKKKLAIAQESKTRQIEQISAGRGYAHRLLSDAIKDITEAEQMIAAMEGQAASLQGQIDALTPSADKAAERAERQQALGAAVLARLNVDRDLDKALKIARGILERRAELTSAIRQQAEALEFAHTLDLDDGRFDALRMALPGEMAAKSEEFVKRFLGRDGDRSPYLIGVAEFVLPETLACHNAFRSGDHPLLTEKESRQLKAESAARTLVDLRSFENPVRVPGAEVQEAPSAIQWGLPGRG